MFFKSFVCILVVLPLIIAKTDTSPNCDVENLETSIDNPIDNRNAATCKPELKYRTYDGSCNNLKHPSWGSADGCYLRLQPAIYEGYGGLRRSKDGGILPEPRQLSLDINKDVDVPTKDVSLLFTMVGQLIAQDITQRKGEEASSPCCSPNGASESSCIPIHVQKDDPYYSQFSVTCIALSRTKECAGNYTGKREQFNQQSAYLDASVFYGASEERVNLLRSFQGGRLKSDKTDGGELLQSGNNPSDPVCKKIPSSKCFIAGHSLANQNSILTSIHTLFMREHNRIADALKSYNPDWDDETLFQEARRIFIAEWQAIIYNEFLSHLLGPDLMKKTGLLAPNVPYQQRLRGGCYNEFGTAAYRLHTMIASQVGFNDLHLTDLFANPDLLRNGNTGPLVDGMCRAPSQTFDRWLVKDVTDHLNQAPSDRYGGDLAAINIQRGRDHGLAPYVHLLRHCSGQNVSSFEDLTPVVGKDNVDVLKRNYRNVEDIDLWVGLQLEHRLPNSVLGSTSACIASLQFYLLKYSDRHFWSHQKSNSAFTEGQINELKKSSISRLLCDNFSEVSSIQRDAFLLPSDQNPVVPCKDIPHLDLSIWSC